MIMEFVIKIIFLRLMEKNAINVIIKMQEFLDVKMFVVSLYLEMI